MAFFRCGASFVFMGGGSSQLWYEYCHLNEGILRASWVGVSRVQPYIEILKCQRMIRTHGPNEKDVQINIWAVSKLGLVGHRSAWDVSRHLGFGMLRQYRHEMSMNTAS